MKILVTGGAGFIGSHTVERLLAEGHDVAVLDNFSTGKRENLTDNSSLDIISGDVRDMDTVKAATKDKDAVLHLAAQVSVSSSIDNPVASCENNVMGFLNVLDSSFRAGVKRFAYASSAAVYGIPNELPLNENSTTDAISPYGLEKLINDRYAGLYRTLYNYSTLGLRYFNVYGSRQDASSPYAGVITKFVSALKLGQPLTILGDGKQTRDYIYVDDIAKINVMALEGINTGICNIGTGKSATLLEMISTLAQVSGQSPKIVFGSAVAGDIRCSSMSPDRLRETFGETELTSLAKGLQKLWEATCA
jgi:UDP-glucose 4-epimerase